MSSQVPERCGSISTLTRPTRIALSLLSSQGQPEEELSLAEKISMLGLLAPVAAAVAVWVEMQQGRGPDYSWR